MSQSGWERRLQIEMAAVGITGFVPQFYFAKPRRWTFDFAVPALMLAVEVEGGIWVKGRHTRGKGYEKDCEKYNEAALRGWKVLRFTTGQVKTGYAITTIERALHAAKQAEQAVS